MSFISIFAPVQRLLLSVIVLCMAISGCIEEFDTGITKQGGTLVITGRITNSQGPHYVLINRTTIEDRISNPVGGAHVTILDEFDNEFQLFEEIPGSYILPIGSLNPFPGTAYRVKIEMTDGSRYASTLDRMPTNTVQDSIYYRFVTLEETSAEGIPIGTDYFETYIDSEIPETDQPIFVRWEVQESYQFYPVDLPDPFDQQPLPCYFDGYPDPQRINLFNNREFAAGSFKNRLVARRGIDEAFQSRYFSNVHQYSLSFNAYSYWNNISSNLNLVGGIFDVPPALVRSNIKNLDDPDELVYGYFEAALEKVSRVSVTDFDVPFEFEERCAYDPRLTRIDQYEPLCQDCQLSNQTIPRPVYFP
ncbi:MAG: DUF4249 domain-containing protein [Cyclobacteriaceae bacterium]